MEDSKKTETVEAISPDNVTNVKPVETPKTAAETAGTTTTSVKGGKILIACFILLVVLSLCCCVFWIIFPAAARKWIDNADTTQMRY